MILYGLMMVIVMIYKPEGFWGISKRAKNTWRRAIGGEKHENA
jgi:branched-chain amino acid transport system permease protein